MHAYGTVSYGNEEELEDVITWMPSRFSRTHNEINKGKFPPSAMGCGSSKDQQASDTKTHGDAPGIKKTPTHKKRTSFKQHESNGGLKSSTEKNRKRPPSTRKHISRQPTDPPREKLPTDGENLSLQGNWELEDAVVEQSKLQNNSTNPPPSPTKSSAFPSKTDFYQADARGLLAPSAVSNSFGELAKYLTRDHPSGVFKVRAIAAWISVQKIRTRQYDAGLTEDTPHAYMRDIKEGRGTFAGLFALICRAAKIPCVIIPGKYKSSFHQIGEDDLGDSKSSWAAVHVDDHWQLIHPYLICTPQAHQPKGGQWRSLETNRPSNSDNDNDDPTWRVFNEFFFLPRPDEFIYTCFPDPAFSDWQLLDSPINFQNFLDNAFLRPGFLQNKFTLKNQKTSVVETVGGKCLLQMKGNGDHLRGLTLVYDLQTEDEQQNLDEEWGSIVLCGRNEDTWNIQIRFPISGVFKVSLFGVRSGWGVWLADFKIVCEQALENFIAQPSVPGEVGWGPNHQSEAAGLLAPSHEGGIIFVKPKEEHILKFVVNKKVKVRPELHQAGVPDEDLKKYVRKSVKNRELDITVFIPDKGDHTLQLYAQDENSKEYQTVCNYLFTDTEIIQVGKKREGVLQRKARERLRKATTAQDIEELDEAMEKFVKAKLVDDDDDLCRARRRNHYLKLKRGLRDGIMRRHEETLAKAIDDAERSPYRDSLQLNIADANQLLEQIRTLDTHCHDVRDMNQLTISELANYACPPWAVHETMSITYLLLGEDYKFLENWAHIQALLHRHGKESIISRINSFTGDVDETIIKRAQNRHSRVLESEVLSASVCASTFYQWNNDVLPELSKGTHRETNTSQNADDQLYYDSETDDVPIDFSNNATDDMSEPTDPVKPDRIMADGPLTVSSVDDDYFSQDTDENTPQTGQSDGQTDRQGRTPRMSGTAV